MFCKLHVNIVQAFVKSSSNPGKSVILKLLVRFRGHIRVCSKAVALKILLSASVGPREITPVPLHFSEDCLGPHLCSFALSGCLQRGQVTCRDLPFLFVQCFPSPLRYGRKRDDNLMLSGYHHCASIDVSFGN